jgi:hypothetical protein
VSSEDGPIGEWRYCPHCARPVGEPKLTSEDPGSDHFQCDSARCSCCDRPWVACPCTPAEDGECKAYVPEGE